MASGVLQLAGGVNSVVSAPRLLQLTVYDKVSGLLTGYDRTAAYALKVLVAIMVCLACESRGSVALL